LSCGGCFAFGFNCLGWCRLLPKHHSHLVSLPIIGQRNLIVRLNRSVQFDAGDATAKSVGILNFNMISRPAAPVSNLKVAPPARHTRIDLQAFPTQLESEN